MEEEDGYHCPSQTEPEIERRTHKEWPWPSVEMLSKYRQDELLDANDWHYLAEGGKSLLVRYMGPQTCKDPKTGQDTPVPWTSPDGRRALALRMDKRKRRGPPPAVQKLKVNVQHEFTETSCPPSADSRLEWPATERYAFETTVITNFLRGLSSGSGTPASPSSSQSDGETTGEQWECSEAPPYLSPLLPYNRRLVCRWHGRKRLAFLEAIANAAEPHRPSHRREMDEIDIDCPDALDVIEDLSWTPRDGVDQDVLCVEIKPKWLFEPGDDEVSSGKDDSRPISRYRKHAILKADGALTPQEVDDLYEPLDLASADPPRVRRALQGLVRNWQKGGNNLRLFCRGAQQPARASSGVEGNNPLANALERLINAQKGSSNLSLTTDAADLVTPALLPALLSPRFQALVARLGFLQRSLVPGPRGDLAHLKALWDMSSEKKGRKLEDATLTGDKKDEPMFFDPSMHDWNDFLTYWFSKEDPSQRSEDWAASTTTPAPARDTKRARGGEASGGGNHSRSSDIVTPPTWKEMRHALIGTLLSGTFKDASIWIRIPMPSSAELQSQSANEGHPGYVDGRSIHLIDVDPKPMKKLSHWLQLDDDIERSYREWKAKHAIQEVEGSDKRSRTD
ncbi:hypothetical protein BDZ90DRAFT_233725 [Jaminaea rosea]|uniref:Inositol-pentakisphosphate 2-kinase n=1 Tax=Jaminaea rosea TaxID=1569628 RepID=A0A316URF6_9BASI|nr:hypothetical protein BDZ90DRAFT_233725 [Jaminaea rosea]PWN25715.1 hypothetical protein BDZ90DRAFT_233725 [Jaminaea rosea]